MIPRTLSIDVETFSTVDIKLGLHAYFTDPAARLLCLAWAFDDEAPALWWAPGAHPHVGRPEAFPLSVWEHIHGGGLVRAWNAGFEWRAWYHLLTKLPTGHAGDDAAWPVLRLEQLRCTQAEAMAMGFPMALGKTGKAMGFAEHLVKDPRGHQLMRICSIPLRPGKSPPTRQDWIDYGDYCKQDVVAERAIARRLKRLPAVEWDVWRLTQRMNSRGLMVDTELAEAVASVILPAAADADARIMKLTSGVVTKATQTKRITGWVAKQGVPITTLRKRSVDDILAAEDLAPRVRDVLVLRREFALSSPRKLGRLLQSCRNRILHDQLLYHGAHTGRWSSVGVQLQNMLRPPKGFDPLKVAAAFRKGMQPPNPMLSAGALIRHLFVARPGYVLLTGDYRQVEARGVAWLAGADELLDAMASGRPIYEDMASSIFGKNIGKDDPERQVGKVTVLGCGYQLGPDGLLLQLPSGSTHELAKACVSAYRQGFPEVPRLWRRCERTLTEAVASGVPQTIGKNIWFGIDGEFLFIQLPSGRRMYYFSPAVEQDPEYGGDKVTFWGRGRSGAAWGKRNFYGGYIVENIVQGFCRDFLAGAMLRMQRIQGWQAWLTAHDEIVMEVPERLALYDGLEVFQEAMEHTPKWAAGFPLHAEVKMSRRYGKG